MCVKHGCPQQQQSQNMAKISILTSAQPQGHVMSVKCEEPIEEFTVQVWLLYHHPSFKYWTLFASKRDGIMDRQTDKRMDDLITRCPRRTFQARGIKMLSIEHDVKCTFFRVMYLHLPKSYSCYHSILTQ